MYRRSSTSCVGDPKCRKPKDLFYSVQVLPLHRLDPMATKWGKGDRRNIINFGNGTGKSDYTLILKNGLKC